MMDELGILDELPVFAGLIIGGVFILGGALTLRISDGPPNTFAGARNRWTLRSERSWVRTNRLGGWLLVVMGVTIAAGGYTAFTISMAVVLGMALALSVVLSAYSYVQWRMDPDRETNGGQQYGGLGLGGREATEKKRRHPL